MLLFHRILLLKYSKDFFKPDLVTIITVELTPGYIKSVIDKGYTEESLSLNTFISFLSSRIRFLNEKLSFMMQDSAEARLYAYLHKRGGYEGKMTALADALCIGRTTLYRTLENLEQNNLITRKGTKVKVIL